MRSPDPGPEVKEPFRWWRIRLYPAVLPAAFIILLWSNASLHPAVLARPLIAMVAISLLIMTSATWIARDPDRGALWSQAILIALIATDARLFSVMVGLAGVIGLAALRMRGREWRLGTFTSKVLGGLSVVLSIALVLRLIGDGVITQSWSEFTLDAAPRSTGEPSPDTPDLIVILLDAYPGQRANEIANAEPDPFGAYLAERGFQVQADSHSNYLFTNLTLGSMFPMQHIGDNPSLQEPWDASDSDAKRIREVVNGAKALDLFALAGYETISIGSGFDHIEIRRVDRFVSPVEVGEFEMALFNLFTIGDVVDTLAPDLFSSQQRSRILNTLDLTAQIASEAHDRPRFLYSHVPAPHAPWVFGPNGEPRQGRLTTLFGDDPEKLGLDRQGALDLATDQARYIGERVVEVVDTILASATRPTTIVVMSDHGTGTGFDTHDATKADLVERFSNFLAVRTHDGKDFLSTTLTPVNLFQRWFTTYLGLSLPPQGDGTYAWQGPYLNTMRVHPVPEWEP